MLNFFKKKRASKESGPVVIPTKEPLLKTSLEEFEGSLKIIAGTLPADIHGAFHVSYPVGSVNSGDLPFPEKNPDGTHNSEYGTPL